MTKLSTAQLYDLYRRLDINGDGELDMAEFLTVGKKLNFTDENVLVRAFRLADASASGKLDMDEFVVAYEAMYDGSLVGDGPDESFVRCTRYGIDKSIKPAKYVMQTYTGTLTALEKVTDMLKNMEDVYDGTIEDITAMMLADGNNNERHGSNVLWWIDICAAEVLPNVVGSLRQNFGLPEDIDDNYFSDFLTVDRESRIVMGSGKISKSGVKKSNGYQDLKVNSLSLFVQSMYMANMPIVHECGRWTDYIRVPVCKRAIEYFYSRFSQFMSYANTPDLERYKSIQRADRIALEYAAIDELPREDIDVMLEPALSPINQLPVPDADDPYIRSGDPQYLLTVGDLKARRPTYVYDNLAVTFLDLFGDGRVCSNLLTFHKIDHEEDCYLKKKERDAEQKSRAGIIGRILWGVYQKLIVVIKMGGAVSLHGDLMDSSAYLAVILINLVHNFNMDTLSVMEVWMSTLEEQMEDMAVTKHNFHIEDMRRMAIASENYMKPFNDLMVELMQSKGSHVPSKKRSGQEELVLNRDVVLPYLGRIGSKSIEDLLEGNQQIELKGSAFWLKKLLVRAEHTEALRTRYLEILDEKRNFWGFLFTIVSLVLWPISTYLGYYGMNYDNIKEARKSSDYPIYGIQFFWLVTAIMYTIMFTWMLDKKIIYMGT